MWRRDRQGQRVNFTNPKWLASLELYSHFNHSSLYVDRRLCSATRYPWGARNDLTMPSKTKKDELLDDLPPSINPYHILGLDSQATSDQVKSAYRKQALKHHPGISYAVAILDCHMFEHSLTPPKTRQHQKPKMQLTPSFRKLLLPTLSSLILAVGPDTMSLETHLNHWTSMMTTSIG